MSVAQTILSQLGGRRFIAMTGAKNFASDGNALLFQLPSKAHYTKNGINVVRIDLDPSDTYTMTFSRQKRAPSYAMEVVVRYRDVYADMLQRLFTDATGLDTHL